MRRLLIAAAAAGLAAFATVAAGQTEDDDRGFLTGLIEDNLSGEGREVTIRGFDGALSSEATIAQMTIADTEGVWLTLEDVVMTWNRRALLRGAIDIRQLRAAQITVARAPLGEDTGPSPEAQPFSLPELPVSVTLGALDIDRISLGPDFLGEPLDFSLTGSARLADGEGEADITAERLGAQRGVFAFDGSFDNETRRLGILLRLDEGEGGIAATLLGLPGGPSVQLEIAGDAPLDDFAATLTLATDGQERLGGDFTLASTEAGTRATLDVTGDVSPLFQPAYADFFGDDASLQAEVLTGPDGAVDIPNLSLDAGRLTLDGRVRIGADGWPQLIDVDGGITAVGSAPVLLPVSGPETFVEGLDLDVSYDVDVSDDWRANVALTGLTRPGLALQEATLTGDGLIRAPAPGTTPAFTAQVDYAADGLSLDDAGAREALGDRIGGELQMSWRGGDMAEISRLTVDGAGLRLNARATIAGPDAGFATDATIMAGIDGLGRFSTLAGRDIGGAAEVEIRAEATPLDGVFDVRIDGQTRDLAIGIPQADRLLEGQGAVAVGIVRDMTGTRIEGLDISTGAASVVGSAALTSTGAIADFTARLTDLADVVPQLDGPASVTGTLRQDADEVIRFAVSGDLPQTEFSTDGEVLPGDGGRIIRASIAADAENLERYAAIAGMPLSGAVDLQAEGELRTADLLFDITLDGTTADLAIGQERLDPFLAGRGRIAGTFRRTAADAFSFQDLDVATPAVSLSGSADIDLDGSNAGDVRVRINDAAILDPGLSGPITASLTATPAAGDATEAVLSVQGAGTSVSADVVVAGPQDGREITGEIAADVAQLGAFADLVGREIAGSIDLSASGSVMPDLSAFETQLNVQSEDLEVGIPTIDPLLAGTGRINATIGLQDGVLGVRTLEVSTREVSIVAALNGAGGFGEGRFNASLRDVGVLTDQISGPVRATGSASLDEAGNWGVDATGTGPGGLSADIAGQYNADGTLDMDIDGSAPLALANAALDPRRLSGQADFALSVNGPPALTSLSGRVDVAGGRLSAPALGQTLTDISGAVTLNGGRAQVDIGSAVDAGGGLTVSGPIDLTGGLDAALTIDLDDVVFRDPDLYQTEIDGRITVTGPLSGGARIAGTLDLGETNVQVPSSSVSALGDLPDVSHVNPPADVQLTLDRAGLLQQEQADAGGGTARPFPLDITINAPSRIFIRGRGLDAELGGSLRIGGTTADVIPVGRFSLIRGRLDILQQRFELNEGSATLQGDFNPFIRLVATTVSRTGTTINIIIEGPAASPEVRFESVPQLPQDEVLAQLIFGRDLNSISPLQAVQLASAVSTLAGRGGGTLDGVRSNLGLDDFDVTTDEDGNAAVRAGAYLSENVYTDVTVNSQGETEINLNLDIASGITAKGGVDQDGETSIGIFFERDY